MLGAVDERPKVGQPTVVIPTHTPELFRVAVEQATAVLMTGGLVALPTETVYGLAANAFDPAAVHKIYEAKGRPARNPVIVHVADLSQARRCVTEWPDSAEALARAFWPGPLTVVLPRSELIPKVVTAGGRTVGVRWPSHPFIQAVIRKCGFPLAAPSANVSMRVSPTNAEHVMRSLGGRIPLIVDGGQSQVGIESTVIDLSGRCPRVLRPGMIHEESLKAVLGDWEHRPIEPGDGLASPGLLPKHYAPAAPLRVLRWADEGDLLKQLAGNGIEPGRTHVLAHTIIPGGSVLGGVSVIPHDPEAFARALYAELHRCDEAEAGWVVVEEVSTASEWSAIADRLRRASA